MDKKAIITFLESHQIHFERDVELRKKTWIHRGGIASLFIYPYNKNELQSLILFLYENGIDFLVVGQTSNLYILNTSNLNVVVSTVHCAKYELVENSISCEAGVGVVRLARDMTEKGVEGFEYLTGLPGTIGGAICNNSSCKTNSIAQLLISADVVSQDGKVIKMYPEDFMFSFRNSIFKQKLIKGVIISAELKVHYGNAEELLQKSRQNTQERDQILEGYKQNLGCTVNRCFCLGRMPLKYLIPLKFAQVFYKFYCPSLRYKKAKEFLCAISGYKDVSPYISDKNPIVFIWKDDNADKVFLRYLEFMERVYRTDKKEVEILR